MLTLIDAGALTKLTHYSRRPHRPASRSTLDNYSRPPLRRAPAPYARGQLGRTIIGITYPKRTSGTYWTMPEQVLLNSPKPKHTCSISVLPYPVSPHPSRRYCSLQQTPLSTVAYLCTLVSLRAPHLRPSLFLQHRYYIFVFF